MISAILEAASQTRVPLMVYSTEKPQEWRDVVFSDEYRFCLLYHDACNIWHIVDTRLSYHLFALTAFSTEAAVFLLC